MLFPTVTFALFFLIVLPVSWALMPYQRAWQVWILFASYVFYGWWDWRFVFLLAGSTIVNHVLAVAIHRASTIAARKTLLALALAFDLGLLGYFKYANFFLSSADNLLGMSWIAHVVLPVGISFFTFMAISYVVDIYRGILEPASLARFAVFQAFFPHLVAGPIVRASELLPQLERPRDPRRVDVSRAFVLIVVGLFKKVVIANYLATHIVDEVFAAPNRHSRSRCSSASTAMPCRSSPTSAATRTSRSASHCCSASSSRRTSPRRTRRSRCRTSGGAGT